LAEFALNTNFQGLDFYDISLVDGFNLPVTMQPKFGVGGKAGSANGRSCNPAGCTADVNSICPNELKKIGASGNVIACKSACRSLQD
jgi:hypothetical protein